MLIGEGGGIGGRIYLSYLDSSGAQALKQRNHRKALSLMCWVTDSRG